MDFDLNGGLDSIPLHESSMVTEADRRKDYGNVKHCRPTSKTME